MATAPMTAEPEPARVRRNWRRAVRCAPALVAPSRYVSELMEFSLAVAGPTMQAQYERFRADPRGRALLSERPDLRAVLQDRDTLAALPAGSLGRAYLEFTSQYRFDAATFETAHDLDGMGRRLGWDADIAYVVGRGLQLHDLWHTLAAYGPDWCGEGGVMSFTRGQIPDTGIAVIATIQRVVPCGVPRRRWTRFLDQARERGRRADNLLVAPYEELLPLDLDEVRDRLGIVPLDEAHPDGVPFVRFGYGFGKTRRDEGGYEPLRLPSGSTR